MIIPTCRVLLAWLVVAGIARVQAKAPMIGVKVVTKYAKPLKVEDRIIDDGLTFRIYTVEQVDDGYLWLVSGSVKGRVSMSDVVPFANAIEFYSGEIRSHPDKTDAYISRGLCEKEKGELDAAIADYTEAIHLNPRSSIAYDDRGLAWRFKNDLDRAIADYNEAIRLDRSYAMAFYNRGNAWQLKKDYDHAIADYNEAIRLEPRLANSYNNRAWLRATCPIEKYRDGKKAVDSATKACELTSWKMANDLGTLAAAYAEAGDFEQAVKWEREAMKLTAPGGREMKGRQDRLALYLARKPFHQR